MSPSALGFLPLYLMTLPLLARMSSGELGTFVTPIVILVAIPVLDALFGRDQLNPEPEHEEPLTRRRGFYLLLWAAVPLQLAVTFAGLRTAATKPLTALQLLDLVLSLGLISGVVAINVAHELVHRPSRFERSLGFLLLGLVGYMHWGIEHVHGHHRWVATLRDPATARRGETLYAFFIRVLAGEARSAWQIERARLAKRNFGPLDLHNRILWFAALQSAWLLLVGLAFGVRAAGVWLASSLVAVLLLQVINYVEHYGLLRRRIDDDHFEKVTPAHSWNASEWLTNKLLFNLQRHSDHHAHAARPYPILRHEEDSPQLPTGYAGMLLLALVPPLWFRVMDRRLPEESPAAS